MRLPIGALPPRPQVASGTKSSKKNRRLGSTLSDLHHTSWSTVISGHYQTHRASPVAYQQPRCSFVSELRQLPEEADTPKSVLLGTLRQNRIRRSMLLVDPLARRLHLSFAGFPLVFFANAF
jgi:hypothetical protein